VTMSPAADFGASNGTVSSTWYPSGVVNVHRHADEPVRQSLRLHIVRPEVLELEPSLVVFGRDDARDP
jgi:hypothetical protein